jgi:hypothetical protein
MIAGHQLHGLARQEACAAQLYGKKYCTAGGDYDASGLPKAPLHRDSVPMKRSDLPSPRDRLSSQLQGDARCAPCGGGEQRSLADRRRRVLWSVAYGSFNARRRQSPRRLNDSRYHALDWHSPHLLAVSIAILILNVADAFFTLTLLSHGAVEVNPVMAVLVDGSPAVFAALKMAMTGISVIMMVLLARYRFMRVVRVDLILYGVLMGYMILIGHEFDMLQNIPDLHLF